MAEYIRKWKKAIKDAKKGETDREILRFASFFLPLMAVPIITSLASKGISAIKKKIEEKKKEKENDKK